MTSELPGPADAQQQAQPKPAVDTEPGKPNERVGQSTELPAPLDVSVGKQGGHSSNGGGNGGSGGVHGGKAKLRIRVSSWSSAPTSPADDGADESANGSESSPTTGGKESSGGGAASRGVKRRRADERESAPSFLEKTYEMLEQAPPELAGWSPHGESFVVKRPDAFAERVIPAYFKHNKFSSFVRQLNFYGFRKVRGNEATAAAAATPTDGHEAVDADAKAAEDTTGWWEFRHDKFVRGQRDRLRDIKRRTNNDGRAAAAAAATATPTATTTVPVDRSEMDELRAEMHGLRDQVQQLNKHMLTVMQALTARSEADRAVRAPPAGMGYNGPPAPLPVTPSAASSAVPTAPYAPQPLSIYPPSTHLPSTQEALFPSPRHDLKTVRSPVGTYHLRPLQSLIHNGAGGGPGTPAGMPPLPSPRPSPMALMSPRLAFLSHAASAVPPAVVSTPDGGSQPHHQEWEAYVRQQQQNQRFAAAARPVPATGTSPDVAVRQLSHMAAQTRNDLLACIVARIIGFLRVQQAANAGVTGSKEVEGVADAVHSDIQQKLAWVHEDRSAAASAAADAASSVLLNQETAAMYRVEILKFISRELPRALQDAVDKRMSPTQKKALNRSLLALLVQKAQAALEHQMRAEPSPTAQGGSGSSNAAK